MTRSNQVWATDITYVPIEGGFLYLCAVIDWYSRAVLAWDLSNTLDARFCVARTRDGGASFDCLDRGLPQPAYDLVYRHGLAVNRDGSLLAMASTTGGLWLSADQGDSWQALSLNLPPVYALTFA